MASTYDAGHAASGTGQRQAGIEDLLNAARCFLQVSAGVAVELGIAVAQQTLDAAIQSGQLRISDRFAIARCVAVTHRQVAERAEVATLQVPPQAAYRRLTIGELAFF